MYEVKLKNKTVENKLVPADFADFRGKGLKY